jgi:cytochrome c-type biogenesis protein CcmH/NrfG
MRRLACLVALVFGLVPVAPARLWGAGPGTVSASARALELQRKARWDLLEASPEGRRRATVLLEQALAIEPNDPTLWHLLGEVYASGRFGTQSRACFEHALGITP